MATQVILRVPDRYLTVGATTGTNFYTAMYNQDYSITYKFSDVGFKTRSMVDLLWPDYDVTGGLILYTERTYSFNLDEAEKTIMENFLLAFNNSMQPFQMTITVDETSEVTVLKCILNDDTTFSKDKFDRWTVTLGLLESSSINIQYS